MTVQMGSIPVAGVNGVGKETEAMLKQLDIETVDDLFTYYPYRYDDYELRRPSDCADGAHVTFAGQVQSLPVLAFYAKKRSRISFRLLSMADLITVTAFNRPYLKRKLSLGTEVTVTGKWDRNRATLTVTELHIGPVSYSCRHRIAPVYSVKEGMTVKRLRAIIENAFRQFPDLPAEILPPAFISRYRLMGRREAVREIHFPTERRRLGQARRRLVYDEFLQYELKMQCYKHARRHAQDGRMIPIDHRKIRTFNEKLPFNLTTAQRRAAGEILRDMASPFAMNRLLQGDVGSGKTVVAAMALYATAATGYQGALMAPTEILAAQHANNLQRLMAPFSIDVALLTGNVRGKARSRLLGALKQGEVNVLIGTHALIQPDVRFHRLGLVVTDEQHRFGVEQRRLLRVKGKMPNVLYMTATPIPRTLALSVFGDMDVSTIDELPGGRKKIKTYWVRRKMMPRIVRFMAKELHAGRQAYVVCPLIEESEQLDARNAMDVHARLTKALPEYTVGLLHGRMTTEEKDDLMKRFKAKRVQALVSTTVIEVGVNVPNATLMVIYDADRFGLSQLHQLRGRVGRGDRQSYCILVADAKSETSREKMKLMTETTDGFRLAEFDLQLRGPGDFFGKKQSGLPEFKLADMIHDYRTLAAARDDAARLVDDSAFWKDDVYDGLRRPLIDTGMPGRTRLD
ncbi:MAG: ATP-dependent DNA helicase RecG [Sporolactobacillus sp.]|jgi:ATP-dependent DNA helicase RecG|nr:ATP-dependent DNA helicase RecG [Sporolactobacillus sp.]